MLLAVRIVGMGQASKVRGWRGLQAAAAWAGSFGPAAVVRLPGPLLGPQWLLRGCSCNCCKRREGSPMPFSCLHLRVARSMSAAFLQFPHQSYNSRQDRATRVRGGCTGAATNTYDNRLSSPCCNRHAGPRLVPGWCHRPSAALAGPHSPHVHLAGPQVTHHTGIITDCVRKEAGL